jgi:hypothetical protein
MKIYLTGSSGFVGTSFLDHFQIHQVSEHRKGLEFFLDSASIIIQPGGKAHNLKNIQH